MLRHGLLDLIYTTAAAAALVVWIIWNAICWQSGTKLVWLKNQTNLLLVMQNRDRARANAAYYCERLGRYRMPFAWTAVYLMNVISSANSLDAEKELQSRSDSLG